MEQDIQTKGFQDIELLTAAKKMGFSDREIARLSSAKEDEVRRLRYQNNIRPVYKMVDTCSAEFEAATPYFYSCYEQENEAIASTRRKIAGAWFRTDPDWSGCRVRLL